MESDASPSLKATVITSRALQATVNVHTVIGVKYLLVLYGFELQTGPFQLVTNDNMTAYSCYSELSCSQQRLVTRHGGGFSGRLESQTATTGVFLTEASYQPYCHYHTAPGGGLKIIGHFVAVDHETKSVVLAVRGTHNTSEWVADFDAMAGKYNIIELCGCLSVPNPAIFLNIISSALYYLQFRFAEALLTKVWPIEL